MTEVTIAGRDPISAGVYSVVPPMAFKCLHFGSTLCAQLHEQRKKILAEEKKVNLIEDKFKMN